MRPQPKDDVWWLRADFHALHREVRGIPVAKISADWCKATEFKRELFPKELLFENGADVLAPANLSFSLEARSNGPGRSRSRLSDLRDLPRTKGRFFLILDAATNRVRFLDAGVAKDRFSAIAPAGRSGIVIMHCLECYIGSTVRWDRARKRFVLR